MNTDIVAVREDVTVGVALRYLRKIGELPENMHELYVHALSFAGIFSAAMMINLAAAALAGALIPLILHRLKIDPARASGILLTTVTDVLGFFVFLGLATWLLIQ